MCQVSGVRWADYGSVEMGRYDFRLDAYLDDRMPGDPETIPASIGEVLVWFEELDEQLSTAIAFLLRRGDAVGRIVTARLVLIMLIAGSWLTLSTS